MKKTIRLIFAFAVCFALLFVVASCGRTTKNYTITIDNQAEDVTISGITSGNAYEYNSQITLTAVNNSGLFLVWTVNGNIEHVGNSYSFKVPKNDVAITTTISSSIYAKDGNQIYFGSYPQTLVSDDSIIESLNAKAGGLPTTTDAKSWTDYNYYISSSVTSFMFYQDIDYDNNGTYDYRGVYFTQYRPYYYSNSSTESDSYQDENGYSTNTIYWFSYDPIEWNILSESDGKALIIANLILDSQDYYPSSDKSSFSHNDGTGYVNNYELSNIRKFLNDDFYNTAFNDLQKALIETTTVDNSASSTGNSSNSYACNNTNDRMFLLSYEEAITTYYTSVFARQAKGSDYAKIQGIYVYINNGNSDWWLRSPGYDDVTNAYYIHNSGNYGCNFIGFTCKGVRPACYINL